MRNPWIIGTCFFERTSPEILTEPCMNSWIPRYFPEVLDQKRLDILPRLKFFTDKWFYLAWGTAISLFYWHRRSIDTEYINLADKLDIASMKLWAIQNRATNKDYVDLYFLVREFWIRRLLDAFFRKYGKGVSESLILKSLVFFDDIVEEPLVMNDSVTFEDVKKFLRNEVLNFGR